MWRISQCLETSCEIQKYRGLHSTLDPVLSHNPTSTVRFYLNQKKKFLTFCKLGFKFAGKLSNPIRFTHPFFEDAMKWTYLKYPDLYLPKANARGETYYLDLAPF